MNSEMLCRRIVVPVFFSFATRFIVRALPERLWYPTVFHISRLQTHLFRSIVELTPYRSDPRKRMILGWLMNAWLRELVTFQRPFPIPLRSKGSEIILDAATNPKGMVICSVHLPMVNLIPRSLVDMNRAPTAVVSALSVLRNGKSPLWGLREGLPVINTDGYVLNRARHVLLRGGSVLSLVDTDLHGSLNPNMLCLVRAVEAQLVFAISELQTNGDIQVDYFAPPDPFCRTDQAILSNLQALQARVDRVLQSPSQRKIAPVLPIRKISSANVGGVELSELDSSS